jgi:hypothetical protein
MINEIKNPEAIILDGFDDCIIGIKDQGPRAVFVYSSLKILRKLAGKLTKEQALEYFYFNIECASFGPFTPILQDDF